jgi:hypothetical protein
LTIARGQSTELAVPHDRLTTVTFRD